MGLLLLTLSLKRPVSDSAHNHPIHPTSSTTLHTISQILLQIPCLPLLPWWTILLHLQGKTYSFINRLTNRLLLPRQRLPLMLPPIQALLLSFNPIFLALFGNFGYLNLTILLLLLRQLVLPAWILYLGSSLHHTATATTVITPICLVNLRWMVKLSVQKGNMVAHRHLLYLLVGDVYFFNP